MNSFEIENGIIHLSLNNMRLRKIVMIYGGCNLTPKKLLSNFNRGNNRTVVTNLCCKLNL